MMSEKILVVSTDNNHKISEIQDIMKDMPIRVLSKKEAGLGHIEVIEDGSTLEENAIKKALGLAKKTDAIVIADDTGFLLISFMGSLEFIHPDIVGKVQPIAIII